MKAKHINKRLFSDFHAVSHVTNDSSFVDLGSQTTPTVLSDILGRHFELHDLVSSH